MYNKNVYCCACAKLSSSTFSDTIIISQLLTVMRNRGNDTCITEIPAPKDKIGNDSRGTFGKCFKMRYKGIPVAVKEFNNLSTAEAVRHEALMMSKCFHPSLPHLFGMNLLLIVIVTLYICVSHGHVSLFPVPFLFSLGIVMQAAVNLLCSSFCTCI